MRDRSDTLPIWLGPLAAVTGVVVMAGVAQAIAGRLPLRPALVLTELALVLPGLVGVWLWSSAAVPEGSSEDNGAGFLRPLGQALRLHPLGWWTTILSLLTGGALWLSSLGLLELQYVLWRPPAGYLDAFRRLHEQLAPQGALDALFSLAAIALMPAACEEVLFRGIVLPSLVGRLGAPAAALGSALLFGLIHVDAAAGGVSFYRVPFAVAVGLGLAVLRLRTGALRVSMLAHGTLNTLTFALVPLQDGGSEVQEPQPVLGALLLVVGLSLTLLLLRYLRPTLIDSPTEQTLDS